LSPLSLALLRDKKAGSSRNSASNDRSESHVAHVVPQPPSRASSRPAGPVPQPQAPQNPKEQGGGRAETTAPRGVSNASLAAGAIVPTKPLEAAEKIAEEPAKNIGSLLGYSDSDAEEDEGDEVAKKGADPPKSTTSPLPTKEAAPVQPASAEPLDEGEELTAKELAPIAHMCGPAGWRWQVTAPPAGRGPTLAERPVKRTVEDDPDFEDFAFFASMEGAERSVSSTHVASPKESKAAVEESKPLVSESKPPIERETAQKPAAGSEAHVKKQKLAEEEWISRCIAKDENSKKAKVIAFKTPSTLGACHEATLVSNPAAASVSSGTDVEDPKQIEEEQSKTLGTRQAESETARSRSRTPPPAKEGTPSADAAPPRPEVMSLSELLNLGKGAVSQQSREDSTPKEAKVARKVEKKPGWMQVGSLCTLCGKKITQEQGGVVCCRRRECGTVVGCGADICWRCMSQTPKDSFGNVRTHRSEFASLGPDAWWMHEACMAPEDHDAYFAEEEEEDAEVVAAPTKKSKEDREPRFAWE